MSDKPLETPPSEPSSPPEDEGKMFEELALLDDSNLPTPQAGSSETEPAVPQEPSPSGQSTEAPVSPEPASLVPEEKPPAAPATELPSPQAPTEPPPVDVDAARTQFLAELEKGYTFSPEEADKLNNEPAAHLPRLAARLHAEVYEAAVRTVSAMLPQFIEVMTTAKLEKERGLGQFYESWPELKGHDEALGRIGKAYRTLNPDAPLEQAIKDIGSIAMTSLGLTRTPQQPQRVRLAPHAPAAPGGSVAPAAPKELNIFEQLALHED